jgi:predicted PurR-regulated permease PerM
MENNKSLLSPRWGSTTKLVVGLTFVAILAGLLIRFQQFLGPILLSFIFSYLLYPVIDKIRLHLKLPWRIAVTIVYLIIIVSFLGLATWGGLSLVEQASSLVKFLNTAVSGLPTYLEQLSNQTITFGPYTFELKTVLYENIGVELKSLIQPTLAQLGNLLTGLASGAASFFAWLFFIFLISYFILSETKGIPNSIINITIPGYQVDITRIGRELSRIWNAFLRGQLLIIALTIVIYTAFLGGMQVNYFIGLAILAGLAKFVPYVGPLVAWTTYGLVAYFQESHIFGMNAWLYVLLIVGIAWLIDTIMDNFVSPRVMADALQVHPAAVMVGALIGISILGVVGVVLAAPVVATIKLFIDYASHKMLDMDPWENMGTIPPPQPVPTVINKVKSWLNKWFTNILNWFKRVFQKQN